jgi:hypothetical protein
MGFNLADYQPVEERNAQFWAKYPEGRIITELVFDDGSRCVFRAEVYTDRDDARPAATGHAEEHVTNTGVNKTSALENCETSAEGRALARLGFAPKGARPSREEMDKARRGQAPTVADERATLGQLCTSKGWDRDIIAAKYEAKAKHPLGEATDPGFIVRFREYLLTLPHDELLAANGVKA